ncbi:MAG: diguanylate cyclase [Cereibacter sp.]|jgi:diguanylate cyclase (GGDEF)-like protein/PAS domain S-box-containing protein|nr:diguanylate cyclase [Cereibacter sp.]
MRTASATIPKRAASASLLLLGLLAGGVLYLVSQLDKQQKQVASLFELRVEVQRLLQTAVDAETAQRGYIIIRRPEMLRPLKARRASPILPPISVDLLPDYLVVQEDALRQLVAKRVMGVESLVGRLASGSIGTAPMQALEAGKELQDEIREMHGALVAAIDVELERQQQEQRQAATLLIALIVATAFAAILLFFFWRRAETAAATIRADVESAYAAAFEDAEIGVAIIDSSGIIRTANAHFLALCDKTPEQALGRWTGALFPQLAGGLLRDASGRVGRQSAREQVIEHATADQIRHVRMTVPGFAPHEVQARRLLLARDVTAEVENQAELRRYQQLLEQAGEIAGFVGWSYDLAKDEILIGRSIGRLLGLPRAEVATAKQLEAVLPRRHFRALSAAIRRCIRNEGCFRLTIRAGNPRLHDIQITGQCRRGGAGAIHIEGSAQDVTQLQDQQRSARRNEEMFKAIASVTNDIIWQFEAGAKHISYLAAPGVDVPSNLFAGTFAAFEAGIHPEDRDSMIDSFAQHLASGNLPWRREYRYLDEQGHTRHARSQAAFIRNESGAVTHVVGGFQDLTEIRRVQTAMQAFAATTTIATEGGSFFVRMLQALAKGLRADAVCISRFDPGNETATTIAALVDGELCENFSYPVAGSPCENLLVETECTVPQDLQLRFPGAGRIGAVVANGYIGGRLNGPGGSTAGFFFALFRSPIRRSDAINSMLQIFVARVEAEIQRLDSSRRLREQAELLDHAKEAIMVCDLDGMVRFWNRGAEELYQIGKAEAIGGNVSRFYRDPAQLELALSEVVQAEQVVREFVQIVPVNGREIVVEESWTVIRSDDGGPVSILKVGSDVSERIRAEAQIRKLAFFDPLTGLPNRRRFLEALDEAREDVMRDHSHGALLFLDLDNFKMINDVHGHLVGDQFLIEIARRLQALCGEDKFVARLGGDEFVVIMRGLGDDAGRARDRAVAFAGQAIADLRHPIKLDGSTLLSSVSIGVALYDDKADQTEELLRLADMAMYAAKQAGRNASTVYDPALHGQEGETATLVADLRNAIDAGQMALWYQPQIEPSGTIYGVEALLRWRHPKHGYVSPAQFIPLAERTGLIVEIGRWVIVEACRQIVAWEPSRICAPSRFRSMSAFGSCGSRPSLRMWRRSCR